MQQIPIAQLRVDDVGRRVIVTQEGQAIEGTLKRLWPSLNHYSQKVTTSLEITLNSTAELKLDALPLDYLIQVDREVDHDLREEAHCDFDCEACSSGDLRVL